MGLIERWLGVKKEVEPQRSSVSDAWDLWAQYAFAGNAYTLPVQTTYGDGSVEKIDPSFAGNVVGAYRANGVVAGCIAARGYLFSQANFQFQDRRDGRYGDFFGTDALEILEKPWPNGSTAELLWRMEQDVSLAGNFYCRREPMAFRNEDRLTRLRPDRVEILLDATENIVGYKIGDVASGDEQVFPVEAICHWSPQPDPLSRYRGMAWLTPVVRNVIAHNAATTHKSKFFEHGATPNMVVKVPKEVGRDEFERLVEKVKDQNTGTDNAYKTLWLGMGADVTVVGNTFEQMSFKVTQGADETTICVAARVPAVIVGVSEGLQGSSLNAGNYGQARRHFADGFAIPQWQSAATALASLVDVPTGSRLAVATRDIPFMREDAKDDSEIKANQAATMRQLIDGGFEPTSVVDAVVSGDFRRLKHTGNLSVQLQPAAPAKNGATSTDAASVAA